MFLDLPDKLGDSLPVGIGASYVEQVYIVGGFRRVGLSPVNMGTRPEAHNLHSGACLVVGKHTAIVGSISTEKGAGEALENADVYARR